VSRNKVLRRAATLHSGLCSRCLESKCSGSCIIYMGLNDPCIQLLNRPERRIYSSSICVGKVTVSSTGYGTTPAISLLFHIPSKPLLGWYRNSRLSKVTCTYRCSCWLYSVFVSRWWSKQQGAVSWKLEERLWLPTRKLALFRPLNFLGSESRNDFTMLHMRLPFQLLKNLTYFHGTHLGYYVVADYPSAVHGTCANLRNRGEIIATHPRILKLRMVRHFRKLCNHS
jgi:hypothetical protein